MTIGSKAGKAKKLRIFKNRWFVRFARQQGIEDTSLCEAIANADRGLIDVDLGGEVIKQRIARPNEGKSVGSGRLSCSAPVTSLSSSTDFRRVRVATFGKTN